MNGRRCRGLACSETNRRHFLSHLGGLAALSTPFASFANSLLANAEDLKKRQKSAILLWMGGGPSTMDIWDLKPGQATGGPFKQISTSVDGIAISEHMPMTARQMHHLSIIRSMSTREADHQRGRYYMHTGFVPNPNVEHPSYGSVIAHELADTIKSLEIPPFISVGGGSVAPGFLGAAWAPFVVSSQGNVKNLESLVPQERLVSRLQMLGAIENRFIGEKRGQLPKDHREIIGKSVQLMTSSQLAAFNVSEEPASVRERYGETNFGRGCLMARRLVEVGVPFVEVNLGGWDNHNNIFSTLADQKLPDLDRAMSALIADIADRGVLDNTAVIWMGEFGRTPTINGNGGRDHWARSWSAVVGGAGFSRGAVIGETSLDGREVVSEPYSSQDLMASVLRSLDIPLDTTFRAKNGRPMKIANGGQVIPGLCS